jgi:hypothetical protein
MKSLQALTVRSYDHLRLVLMWTVYWENGALGCVTRPDRRFEDSANVCCSYMSATHSLPPNIQPHITYAFGMLSDALQWVEPSQEAVTVSG